MRPFHYDHHTSRPEFIFNGTHDVVAHALLQLRPLGMAIHDMGKLRETHHTGFFSLGGVGQVAYVSASLEMMTSS